MSSRDITLYSGSRGGVMPLSEAMSQLFRDAFTSSFGVGPAAMTIGQAVNLYEQNNNYILQVPLPSIKQDQLNITARENVVTLRGTTEIPTPEGARPLFQGIGGGQFREQVVLPSDIDAENASAQYQDGILTLVLPKAQHARERSIPISVGAGQGRLGTGERQGQAGTGERQGQLGTGERLGQQQAMEQNATAQQRMASSAQQFGSTQPSGSEKQFGSMQPSGSEQQPGSAQQPSSEQ